MIKLTPSSIGVMVDTLRYSGRDRYIIFRMKTREQKVVYMRYPQHIENMANQENMIVIVDAQKFLSLWQRSPYEVDKNTCASQHGEKIISFIMLKTDLLKVWILQFHLQM